ncbi:MAG: 16S rRNA (cytidine(1402)-2'-O)-methyltransferase [Tenericutes bacterium]|nr:16S rRNA (cytidine(1402)-2'-O)-methyltransferase [Mycoplasmatota bacterium]
MNQKSYENSKYGKLYLIPTPIGNLEDITLRAIKTLEMVDIVYAEDTRETNNLLKYLKITKKVESCHKYTEMKHKNKIIEILKSGKNIGYVTDRGTPLISDPGNIIVEEAISNGIIVISLPGPNALLPAINMSGLSNEKFLFYGFLNSKPSISKKELIELKDIKQTIILYESPHRLTATLKQILAVFGNRKIAIVREISKLYEEIIRDNIENILKISDNLKGEIVIVIEGNTQEKEDKIDYNNEISKLIQSGYSKRDAVREVADKYNMSKNKLYNEFKEN